MRNRVLWILSVSLVFSPVAKAENKLFITDVLDPGQMEAQGTLRSTRSSNVSFTSGSGYRRTSRATVSLGRGLSDGFQLDAAIPFVALFAIPYLSFFLLVLLPLVLIADRRELRNAAFGYGLIVVMFLMIGSLVLAIMIPILTMAGGMGFGK